MQGHATLRWAAGNTQDISFENGASQIKIGDAVTATFDTNGNNVTLGSAFDLGSSQTAAIIKSGAGTLTLAGSNTYTGTTTVSAGTMLVTGQLGNTVVTVESNGVIGGSGMILGSLNLDAGADLFVNLAAPLSITGAVTFDGFGVADLLGWDYTTAENGTYTLLSGSNISLTNVANVGLENAFDLGAGRKIYFQTGSLQAVVVPEASTLLLGALGVLGLLRRRR
jgi:autotransporter-associated beta strand protein